MYNFYDETKNCVRYYVDATKTDIDAVLNDEDALEQLKRKLRYSSAVGGTTLSLCSSSQLESARHLNEGCNYELLVDVLDYCNAFDNAEYLQRLMCVPMDLESVIRCYYVDTRLTDMLTEIKELRTKE